MQRFSWYCLCGAHWSGNQHPNAIAWIKRQWDAIHAPGKTDGYGDKHGPTDRNTCNRARAKAERQAQNAQVERRAPSTFAPTPGSQALEDK